ncbi:MAG: hypothetical protein PHF37_05860 [Phycisphaerae bacterium]|nr:hypothetical protein [Phycisphaerae bacterium]
MNEARTRSRKIESVISFLLLAVLVGIVAGVFIRQFGTGSEKFGIDPVAAGVIEFDIETAQAVTPQINLSKWTPTNFFAAGKSEVYTADTLYEKINGKAPLYTDAGFERLFTQRYMSADSQLGMELYLFVMKDATAAFTVYSTQKRPQTEPVEELGQAYRTSNALYLAHGKFYVELVGFAEDQRLFAAQLTVGRQIEKELVVEKEQNGFAIFPSNGLIKGSEKLYTDSAFGFDRFGKILTVRYRVGSSELTAFLGELENSQKSCEMAEGYVNFLKNNGAMLRGESELPDGGKMWSLELYGFGEIVLTCGRFVGGVHEAEDLQAAKELIRTIADNIRNR